MLEQSIASGVPKSLLCDDDARLFIATQNGVHKPLVRGKLHKSYMEKTKLLYGMYSVLLSGNESTTPNHVLSNRVSNLAGSSGKWFAR